MSYLSWRNTEDNEAKYMKKADAGEIHTWPAFDKSSFDPALDELVKSGVSSILENEDISLPSFVCVFAEYLHETYGLTPADTEVFVQTCITLLLKHMNDTKPIIFRSNEATGELELIDPEVFGL